MKVSEGNH
jgi:ATP-binding cassette subfamily B (MDR/TAP) protein 1